MKSNAHSPALVGSTHPHSRLSSIEPHDESREREETPRCDHPEEPFPQPGRSSTQGNEGQPEQEPDNTHRKQHPGEKEGNHSRK
jgi:hypothetical protein